ncbi:MAG: E3 binding domain-containing protein, partial [Planctomycetota bacterium]
MTDVTIPSPGESITEVRIGAWKRGDGDWVEKDELLNEIESDKATLELLAPAAGTLKVTAQSGSDQKVGAIVAKIDEKAKRTAGAAVSAAHYGTAASTARAAEAVEPNATSVAKKMAADKGVDIAKIEGTGPGGRVTKADVEHAGAPAVAAAPSGAAPAKASAPTFQFTGSRGVRR